MAHWGGVVRISDDPNRKPQNQFKSGGTWCNPELYNSVHSYVLPVPGA